MATRTKRAVAISSEHEAFVARTLLGGMNGIEAVSTRPKSIHRLFQVRLRTLLLLITAVGVFLGVYVNRANRQRPALVRVWFSPSRKAADPKGLPPSWPTAAAVLRYAPNAPGADQVASANDATLFLLADPDLTEKNVCEKIATSARLAIPCRIANLRGNWLDFAGPTCDPLFVLSHAGGLTLSFRVFERHVLYYSPFQVHTYRLVFHRTSKYGGLATDLNGDGQLELLLGRGYTVPELKLQYEVYTWDEELGAFRELPMVTEDEVKSLSERIDL